MADGRNPVDLPAFVGTEWIGRRVDISPVELEILPPDTGFSRRIYVAVPDPRRQVLLSIVLSGRDRSSIHRPELCVEGQGWTIKGSFPHGFEGVQPGGRVLPATVLRLERAGANGAKPTPALLAYWFVSSETVVATHAERMWRGAWDRLRHGRADRWAYVLAQTVAAERRARRRRWPAFRSARLRAPMLAGTRAGLPEAAGRPVFSGRKLELSFARLGFTSLDVSERSRLRLSDRRERPHSVAARGGVGAWPGPWVHGGLGR
jgi:hypothetical protein